MHDELISGRKLQIVEEKPDDKIVLYPNPVLRKKCEEVKGFAARDWPLRAAIFIALYPEYTLREV